VVGHRLQSDRLPGRWKGVLPFLLSPQVAALVTGRTVAEIRANQRDFQKGVLQMQIEQERSLDPNEVWFLDRALPDALAYCRFLSIAPAPELIKVLKTVSYRKVFILDLLPLQKDYARTEDTDAQRRIHELLIEVYQSLSFPCETVPALPPDERVEHILRHM
jgi:predicted ATPase